MCVSCFLTMKDDLVNRMMEPKQKTKADRTLEAARRLFFEKGFVATSNREVAQAARTSKTAIYDHFGSMEGLLEAVITAEIERFDPGPTREITSFDEFRETLVAFGTGMLAFLDMSETIRFSKIMHEQSRTHPGVTRLYFEASYVATANRVQVIIDAGLHFSNGKALSNAGERYISMLKGHRYEMAILGIIHQPYPEPELTSAECFDAWFAERR